ncbi:MAG: hypothetical protein ACYSWU_28795 [Planctomycetota bacterium]|jgi:hypothetical protein
MMPNQDVSTKELEAIRSLEDFDLIMLLSETHDHGWPWGRALLRLMPTVKERFSDHAEMNRKAASEEPYPKFAKTGRYWQMLTEILEWGGVPAIVIGMKQIGSKEVPYVDYVIAGELDKDKVLYVLRRLVGLIDGTIKRKVEEN